ncbi:MAG: phosphatase PAP2 family protein [Saprospiraceae bacterium]|nr:phosphatase PAP2 family protein [Saprospiraceae bacterium]
MMQAAFRVVIGALRPFLIACLVFWAACLSIVLLYPIGVDLVCFNLWKGTSTDLLFIYGTKWGEEYGYIVITLILLVSRWKDAIWIPLVGFFVSLFSFLTKMYFRSPRPGHYANADWFRDQIILVDGITPLSGFTSFPSGHTMSAFALAAFTIYLYRSKRWLWVILFALAILVAVSRIYLVMHFLRDVLFGSFLGVVLAIIMAVVHFLLTKKRDQSTDSAVI